MRWMNRGMMQRGCSLVLAAVVVSGVTAGPALAQNAKPAESFPKPVLVMEKSALADWAADPRDAGLARAMRMLPARVEELRLDAPDMPPQAATALDMVMSVLARPMRVALIHGGPQAKGGLFGYGLVVASSTPDEKSAREMHEAIMALLGDAPEEMQPQESRRIPGGGEIVAGPAGVLAFGPARTASGWSYQVQLGSVADADAALMLMPAPGLDGTPLLRGRFDLAMLTPAVKMGKLAAGDDIPEEILDFLGQLESHGVLGESAMKLSFEMSATTSHLVTRSVIEGIGAYREKLRVASEPLTEAHLRAIPADATIAWVARADFGWLTGLIDRVEATGAGLPHEVVELEQRTGVDLRRDVLDALGGVVAAYASDSTGGGGVGSMVALLSYKDRERFLGAHAKLLKLANALMAEAEIPAKVHIVPWKDGETTVHSLRVDGLPIPFEISYAATMDWLIVGLTPQAVVAASRQAEGRGDAGVTSLPAFSAMSDRLRRGVIAVSYMDTPRMIRRGYPLLSMAGSAVSNALRSRHDAERDPGMVVPLLADLLKGAQPAVSLTAWEGDHLVSETRGDRSVVATAGALTGAVMELTPLIVGIGAAANMGGGMGGGMSRPFGLAAPSAGMMRAVANTVEPWWTPVSPLRLAAWTLDPAPVGR